VGLSPVEKKSPGLDAGALPLSRRRVLAVSDALVYPVLHLIGQPRYSALTESYPFRELVGSFEPRDVSEAVRYSE